MSYDRERERGISINIDRYIQALSMEEASDLIDYIDEDAIYSREAITISEEKLKQIKPKLLKAAHEVYAQVKRAHETHVYPLIMKKVMKNQKYASAKERLKKDQALKEMKKCFEWYPESKFIKGYVEEIFKTKSTKQARQGCEILSIDMGRIRELIGENIFHSVATTILNLPDILFHAIAIILENTRCPIVEAISHIIHIVNPSFWISSVKTLPQALVVAPLRVAGTISHSYHTGTNVTRQVNYSAWTNPNKWFGFGWKVDAGHVVSRLTYNAVVNDYVLVVYPKFKIKK